MQPSFVVALTDLVAPELLVGMRNIVTFELFFWYLKIGAAKIERHLIEASYFYNFSLYSVFSIIGFYFKPIT
jgi:hypothetical protein